MSTVTGFKAVGEHGHPVQVDAHGNNAAFSCLHCHAPLLSTLRENQRGASPMKPVICRGCGNGYWVEVKDQAHMLVIHEAPDSDHEDASLPRVVGRPSKDAGLYRLGAAPGNLAPHNQASWSVIAAILGSYGTADYYDMAVAVRSHQHGDKKAVGPQSFISYCIRSGWLQRA